MSQDFSFWRPHVEKYHARAWELMAASLPSIGELPRIEWSNRLTSTAGKAFFESGFIRLSSKLFWQYPEGFILEIIPHELAHIAAWRAFQDDGHGKGWKHCMFLMRLPADRCWSPARMLIHKQRFWKTQ